MNNQLQTKPKFSLAIQTDNYKKLINNTLGDPKRAAKFIASISSAVAINPSLQECDAGSILAAALLGEALNLSPSPQLGQYYLVKYDKKQKINGQWVTVSSNAQFQMGYKGYIQLAIRSGQYKDIDVIEVREGEFLGRNKATGKYQFEFIDDEVRRESKQIIGYMAYFEYLNGFSKTLYWTKEKMMNHAKEYSQSYSSDLKNGTQYSYWSKDFNGMAFKTMLRQLISKWGVMSIDMQEALSKDMSVIKEDGTYNYIDNQEVEIESTLEVYNNTKDQEITSEDEIKPKKVNLNEL
ncbi:MAG: recombinase RecT [Bacilli bacterium]|nr:recombinase RecT [Bacilli bacterium]